MNKNIIAAGVGAFSALSLGTFMLPMSTFSGKKQLLYGVCLCIVGGILGVYAYNQMITTQN